MNRWWFLNFLTLYIILYSNKYFSCGITKHLPVCNSLHIPLANLLPGLLFSCQCFITFTKGLLVEFSYWPVLTEQDFPIGCYQRLACGVLLLASTYCGRIFLLAVALKAIGKPEHKGSKGIVKPLANHSLHMEIRSGLPILFSNCWKACLYLLILLVPACLYPLGSCHRLAYTFWAVFASGIWSE